MVYNSCIFSFKNSQKDIKTQNKHSWITKILQTLDFYRTRLSVQPKLLHWFELIVPKVFKALLEYATYSLYTIKIQTHKLESLVRTQNLPAILYNSLNSINSSPAIIGDRNLAPFFNPSLDGDVQRDLSLTLDPSFTDEYLSGVQCDLRDRFIRSCDVNVLNVTYGGRRCFFSYRFW